MCHNCELTTGSDSRRGPSLAYLNIYDAPHELPDAAIIHRLAPFCEVIHHRRGKFREPKELFNGVSHYRVKIRNPIPSYLRFGKIRIALKHQGQEETCRHCNLPGHYAHSCNQEICYNCDTPGHQARTCPNPILCSICHSDSHRARACTHSWSPTVRVTKSRFDQAVEVEGVNISPQDTMADFNLFSVLPQEEENATVDPPPQPSPSQNIPTEPEPEHQVNQNDDDSWPQATPEFQPIELSPPVTMTPPNLEEPQESEQQWKQQHPEKRTTSSLASTTERLNAQTP